MIQRSVSTFAFGAVALSLELASPVMAGAGLGLSPGLRAAPPIVLKAAYGPAKIAAMLRKRGYRKVRIAEDPAPGYRALACKGRTAYQLEIDPAGRIMERAPAGLCGGPPPGGVHVRTPFVGVDVDRRDGVRVRAPFVDIWVPRR
ncbi:MAG: hypothetical protein ACR2PO_20565 [Methyloligellaceae bacterium]